MIHLPYRLLAALGLVASVGSMAFALYLQHGHGLEPCPLCVFQRVAMIVFGLVCLLALLHGPRAWGRWVYALLGALSAGAGIAIAGRHVWLQGLPPDQVPACGPSLDYLMDISPFFEVVKTVLRGDGNCTIVDAAFAGLSLPAWTLIAFVILGLASLVSPLIAQKDARA